MEVRILYDEITQFLKERYHVSLKLENVSARAVAVVYTVKMLKFSKNVTLDLTIEDVKPSSVTLSYGGSIGVGTIMSGVLMALKALVPEVDEAISHQDGKSLIIDLDRIEKLEKMLNFLELANLEFTHDAIVLTANCRMKMTERPDKEES